METIDEFLHGITQFVIETILGDLDCISFWMDEGINSHLTHAVSPPTSGCSSIRSKEYDGAVLRVS